LGRLLTFCYYRQGQLDIRNNFLKDAKNSYKSKMKAEEPWPHHLPWCAGMVPWMACSLQSLCPLLNIVLYTGDFQYSYFIHLAYNISFNIESLLCAGHCFQAVKVFQVCVQMVRFVFLVSLQAVLKQNEERSKMG
jgi:hypothetical protein